MAKTIQTSLSGSMRDTRMVSLQECRLPTRLLPKPRWRRVRRKHPLRVTRCMDEDRDESVTKVRRNGTSRVRDGHEDQEMLVIMDLMCEEANEDHKEINDYKKANLEESFDWDQHPRMSWADAHDEEFQPKCVTT